jgi:hypothetical protein
MRRSMWAWLTAATLSVLWASGCIAPAPTGPVTDPNPEVKIPAMKRAVAAGDLGVVRHLVNDLASDDPAVRFYAIQSLEKLAGTTNGYEYFGEEPDRAKAVERWKQWLHQRETSTSAGTTTRPQTAGLPSGSESANSSNP